jgi:outer membrane receptor protein involved in Fe transport
VRAPNIQELFLPQGLNLFSLSQDPCSNGVAGGLSDGGYTQAQCAASGVPASAWGNDFNSPAGQYNFLQGGNPDLAPEESDTWSYGVVWTPDFLEGFALTVDYYDIEIEDGINNLDQEFILTECLEGNESQCANVQRSRNGDLWVGSDVVNSGKIVALQDNLAIEKVEGYDIIATYDFDMGSWGSMNLHNVLSYVDVWDTQELKGAPTVECAGTFGATCGFPTPEYRNNLRATWTTPWDVTASFQWRYMDEVSDLNIDQKDLDQMDYFDLAAIWDVTDYATIRAGVNNLTDEEPPIVGSAAGPQDNGNGNTFPGAYDALGRYWFIGASIGF